MKLVKACIALAAFAAIFVIPSMASALTLTHPTGTTAPVGTKILATNVEHATTKTALGLTTSIGTLECTKATLTGELTQNGGGANVEGNITTAEFGGTVGVTTTGHCNGSGIIGSTITPTPSHTSDEDKSLPWCFKAGAEDKFTVRGGKCSEASRAITYTLHGAITCTYEAPELIGTYTTHPADAIVTIVNQEVKRSASSSAFCPATGKMDLAFTLATDVNDVSGAALYLWNGV